VVVQGEVAVHAGSSGFPPSFGSRSVWCGVSVQTITGATRERFDTIPQPTFNRLVLRE
jgi:hypothetical protein